MRLFVFSFVTALIACAALTPPIRWLARKLNIVDHPDNHRKLHEHVTPLGGGIAILLAFLGTIALASVFSTSQRAVLLADLPFVIGGIGATMIICLVGLLDDRYGLRGRQKLAGQVLAASCWLASGMWIERIALFGWNIELGLLAIPFTLFWLLGAINALNLLDGVDGLATSVGLVISGAIAFIALHTGHSTEAFMALAMAGALAGFLIYNRPRASIFLGDAGSMLIGLVLGMLAIRSSLKGPATVALAAPTALWAIPILDVSMAILRRKLTGQSIYTTDRGHLHHVILRRGFSGWYTVMIVAVLCLATCGAAMISVYMHSEVLATGAVCIVVGILIVTRVFGHHECSLMEKHTKRFLLSLVPHPGRDRRIKQPLHARVQGTRPWEELWDTLTQFAERFDLSDVQLNVAMPAIEEEYHAAWKRKEQPPDAKLWRSEIPLLAGSATVGRLSITGVCHGESACLWMGEMIAGLKPFETHMLELLEEEEGSSDTSGDDFMTATVGQSTDY